MKYPRWGRVLPLLLMCSCVYAGRMAGENKGDQTPPKNMQVCIQATCEEAVWAGDHYEGHQNGALTIRYWIKSWQADKVELSMKSAKAADGVYPVEGTMTGTIAADGVSVKGGTFNWRIGNSQSGTMMFSLAWINPSASAKVGGNAGQPQPSRRAPSNSGDESRTFGSGAHRVNGILVPAGASDVFASFPDDVRAILLSDYALSSADAMRPCDDAKEDDKNNTGVYDPVLSLEIGKFALRRGEYLRGRCWINHSAVLNANPRAVVLLGVMFEMGWTFPKDPARAFQYFDGGGFKQRDPWAIYFMEQAFRTGNGVPKNPGKAAEFDSYLMTHDDGQALYAMIGADDAAVVWRAARMKAIADAPTKPSSTCSNQPTTNTQTGAIVYKNVCNTTYGTDQDALQRELDEIDRKYHQDMNAR